MLCGWQSTGTGDVVESSSLETFTQNKRKPENSKLETKNLERNFFNVLINAFLNNAFKEVIFKQSSYFGNF